MSLTITEALAEIKTIGKRIEKKREYILNYLVRQDAKSKGIAVVAPGGSAAQPLDLIINIDESELAKEIEAMEETLGQLDGQLSLKNATVVIEA